MSQIPLYAKERTKEHPFVIGGGPCTYNPEPLADFFDLFYIGEGETVYYELFDRYKEWKSSGKSRKEFLEMAARLVHIKSVMLLPKYEEEAEILKEELTGQLIEYRECRRIAKLLSEMVSFDAFCRDTENIKFDMTYTREHDPIEIAKAYIAAVGRGKSKLPPPKEAFSGIVTRKITSVNSKIVYILKNLRQNKKVTYKSLFASQNEKSELVATFLALLELVKGRRVRINGDGEYADIVLLSGGRAI